MKNQEKDVFDRLPVKCFVVEPASKKVVIVKRGVSGYYPCPMIPPGSDPQAWADQMNEQDGVTKFQADAMLNGSIWGFHVPVADPRVLEKEAEAKGKTEFYPRTRTLTESGERIVKRAEIILKKRKGGRS